VETLSNQEAFPTTGEAIYTEEYVRGLRVLVTAYRNLARVCAVSTIFFCVMFVVSVFLDMKV